jgi:hypothetical protein
MRPHDTLTARPSETLQLVEEDDAVMSEGDLARARRSGRALATCHRSYASGDLAAAQ